MSITTTQIWMILKGAYHDHTHRGEEIEEFNLCPNWMERFRNNYVIVRKGIRIPIVSRGWTKVDDGWYLEVSPFVRVTQYTIKVKE